MNTFAQGLPEDGWDERQQSRNGHMLQGLPWAAFQEALGRKVVWAEGDGWSWMGIITAGRGVTYLYVPYGPTVRSATSLVRALASLKDAAIRLRVDFVRCEPVGVPEIAVAKSGLKPVAMVQPPQTQIIELTQSEVELRKGVNSGHRNAINGAERRGLEIAFTRDPAGIAPMLALLHTTASGRGFRPHPDGYYVTMLETLLPQKAATMGFVRHEGKVVAGAIFLDYRDTRAYAHAGSVPEARSLQAAVPLVWEAALDAQESGLRRFDLWGIAPSGAPATHPWSGFTKFKQAFGGSELFYTGTWEMPIKPVKYRLIRLAKQLRS